MFLPCSSTGAEVGIFPELKGRKNTMNFKVWAPTQKDADVIAGELDEYYRRFLRDLEYGGMLKKRPQVYIFKNYRDYLDKTGPIGYNVAHTGGIAVPRSARKPAKVYSFLSDNLLDEVLPRELTHLLFKEITAGLKTDIDIPLWLGEGFAAYEEEGRRHEAIVEEARNNNRLIPIAEIVNCTDYPHDLHKKSLLYAQSASLVDFLLDKYGGAKFLAFSKKLIASGKNINEVLPSTYYPHIKNVSQFSDAWLKFLESSAGSS